MRKSFKYRLYPTKEQERKLQASLDACRWVYNETLATRKALYESQQITLSKYDTNSLLPVWKETRPQLKLAYSQSLQETQERVDLAFRAFFQRLKRKQTPGYPRFKSYDRYNSFSFPQNPPVPADSFIKIPKVGCIKVKQHRNLLGIPKRLTITVSQTGKWYACYSCDDVPVTQFQRTRTEKAVGIDLGCKDIVILSNGCKVPAPKHLKASLAKIRRASKRFSNNKTVNRRRALAGVHEKVVNQRKDFTHKLSRQLVNDYTHIYMEDLNIKGMVEGNKFRSLNRSIMDCAWNQLVLALRYKAEEAGTEVILVDPKNTTRRCSKCGKVGPKKNLGQRIHNCSCGLKIDRDLNAAYNILALGQKSLAKA